MMTLRRRTRDAARNVLVLCALAAPPGAHAVWEAVPEMEITASSVENPRLREEVSRTAGKTILDARVSAQSLTERGLMSIEPRIRPDAYADSEDEELDTEDVFLRAQARYNWRAASVGVRFNGRRLSVLHSEIVDAIPDDPDADLPADVDSGFIEAFDEDQTRLVTVPYVQFDVSDRSTFRFEARYVDVSYSGAPVITRTDFDSTELSAAIIRNVDERTQVTARVFTSSFDAVVNSNTTDTVGVYGTFTRPVSETWSFTLSAGVQRNEFNFVDRDDSIVDNADTNPTIGVSFRRRGDRTLWNIDALRHINANASGFVAKRDELRLLVEREFTQRLTGALGLRAYATGVIGNVPSDDQRDDERARLSIEWAMTPRWFIGGGFDYVSREFRDIGTNTSREIYISILYRGLSRR